MSAQEAPNFTKNPYIIQSVLLLLGPALFAATVYMALGRLMTTLEAGHLSLVRVSLLTKTFVAGDVLSFLAQSGGGGMLATAKTADAVKRGENIIVGGLGIQIIFFGLFIAVTAVFHRRISNNPTSTSLHANRPWKKLLMTIYAVSFLIMIRSLFRVAEYVTGRDGVLQQHEYWIYIFDAALMVLASCVFNVFHPGGVIGRHSQDKSIALHSRSDSAQVKLTV